MPLCSWPVSTKQSSINAGCLLCPDYPDALALETSKQAKNILARRLSALSCWNTDRSTARRPLQRCITAVLQQATEQWVCGVNSNERMLNALNRDLTICSGNANPIQPARPWLLVPAVPPFLEHYLYRNSVVPVHALAHQQRDSCGALYMRWLWQC